VNRLVMALAALSAAGSLFAGAAQAQEDAFTVGGVPIDATAENAAVAREQAIAAGTPRALRRLFQRLVLAEDMSRVPEISSGQATSMAIGFQVDNELRSATRYRGDLTVSFEPESVRRVLRNYGVPFVESAAPPTLVVPVYRVGGQASLFNANPWAEGWDEARYIGGFAPVVVPTGFGSRASMISPQAVASGDLDTLSLMADSYGVDRVLLAVAEPQGQTLNVDLTLVRMESEFDVNALTPSAPEEIPGGLRGDAAPAAETPDPFSQSRRPEPVSLGRIQVQASESQTPFQLAADRAHEVLSEEWKQQTVIRSQSRTDMQLTVLFDNIREWHSLRSSLSGSPFVTDVRLDALARDGAYMQLTYRGVREQLAADLLRRGVRLRSDFRMGEVAQSLSRAGGLDTLSAPAPGAFPSGAGASMPSQPPAAFGGVPADEVLRRDEPALSGDGPGDL